MGLFFCLRKGDDRQNGSMQIAECKLKNAKVTEERIQNRAGLEATGK